MPVGYIYQVIYWGYGGMGSHETQVPIVADRWRIIAYVRALQYSQAVPAGELSADTKKRIEDGRGQEPLGKQGESGTGAPTTKTGAGQGSGSIKRPDSGTPKQGNH